jgi:hypothetical protein
MITQPICFVIGAGASNCYGFPLGKQLSELLTNGLQPSSGNPLYRLLRENAPAFSPDAIENFRRKLFMSGQNSVDAFLETNNACLDVGKAAMAALLLQYENPDFLWNYNANNWMRYLFERMRAPTLEAFAENKVSFVTFNFDRSLEHFLFTSLMNTYEGSSETDCAKILGQIPIIHLHGRLGYLSWQGAKLSRPYSVEITPAILDLCVRNIRLIHEELEEERFKDFEAAKSLMRAADMTYFIGFGFAQLNIERLALKELGPKGIATAVGFTNTEVGTIRTKFDLQISLYPNLDIEALFRNNITWQ